MAEAAWVWQLCVISPNVWVEPSDLKIGRTGRDWFLSTVNVCPPYLVVRAPQK